MNKYQFVKEQLSAKEVVKNLLGEPQKISGDNYFWSSPFREGDNDPSLCVNEIQISDFGDETFKGKDIFNFVSRYKGISNEEAFQYIVETYNIEAQNIFNTFINIKKNTNKNITYKYVLQPTDEKPDGIYCMFDNQKFNKKPTGNEIGTIKNKISSIQPMVYTIDNIKQRIIEGQTCIPSAIKSQADWKDDENWLQLFFVDIDNVKTVNNVIQKFTVDDEEHVTVDKIVKYCEEMNLIPTFIYHTFSHSEQQHKFRLVYVLNIGTQKQEEIEGVYDFLKETFKDYNIDTAPTNIASMFFGGIDLAYESNQYYSIKKEVEQTIIPNMKDSLPVLINDSLNYSPYVICNGQIGILKKDEFKPIANFIPYCTQKLTYKNGQDTEVFYVVNCRLLDSDKQEEALIITTDQFQKFNFIIGSPWDKDAIIRAGSTNSDKLREVMQLVNRYTMEEKEVYSHTGFIRKDDKLCFLYHGGAIGDVNNIDVDLSRDSLQQYCFTDKIFDVQTALKRSLSFLDVASEDITIPLMATIYVAPQVSLLQKEHIPIDVITFVYGKTGSRKSSLVGVAMSHYGNFDRDHFPCSFRDTYNSIEKKAFILKDVPNVIDDYNPEAVGNKKLASVQEIYAMYGDRTGRTRMKQDATLRIAYTARGVCIITGETIPDVPQSRIARSITVNILEDSIDLNKLTELQENTEELAFAFILYIEWIIQNEQKIIENAKSTFKEIRTKQKNGIHGRTIEILASLIIGFECFTKFMLDNNVISVDEKQVLDEKAYNTISKLVEEQTQMVKDLKPTEMFYNAVEQLFATGSMYVNDYATNLRMDGISKTGTNVGFYDTKQELFYFYPNVLYNQIQGFYNNGGTKFPINEKALWKYLYEEGNLYRTDEHRYTIKRNGKTVVAIRKANLQLDTTCEIPHNFVASRKSIDPF